MKIRAKNVIILSLSLAFPLLSQDPLLCKMQRCFQDDSCTQRYSRHSQVAASGLLASYLSQPTELAECTQSSWPGTQGHSQSRKLFLKNTTLAITVEEQFQCYTCKKQFSFPSKSLLAKTY